MQNVIDPYLLKPVEDFAISSGSEWVSGLVGGLVELQRQSYGFLTGLGDLPASLVEMVPEGWRIAEAQVEAGESPGWATAQAVAISLARRTPVLGRILTLAFGDVTTLATTNTVRELTWVEKGQAWIGMPIDAASVGLGWSRVGDFSFSKSGASSSTVSPSPTGRLGSHGSTPAGLPVEAPTLEIRQGHYIYKIYGSVSAADPSVLSRASKIFKKLYGKSHVGTGKSLQYVDGAGGLRQADVYVVDGEILEISTKTGNVYRLGGVTRLDKTATFLTIKGIRGTHGTLLLADECGHLYWGNGGLGDHLLTCMRALSAHESGLLLLTTEEVAAIVRLLREYMPHDVLRQYLPQGYPLG